MMQCVCVVIRDARFVFSSRCARGGDAARHICIFHISAHAHVDARNIGGYYTPLRKSSASSLGVKAGTVLSSRHTRARTRGNSRHFAHASRPYTDHQHTSFVHFKSKLCFLKVVANCWPLPQARLSRNLGGRRIPLYIVVRESQRRNTVMKSQKKLWGGAARRSGRNSGLGQTGAIPHPRSKYKGPAPTVSVRLRHFRVH